MGQPEWQRSYSRRNAVESDFGVAKSSKSGNLKRGWTHQVGLVKHSLLLALFFAAQNLKMLTKWARAVGDTRDPLTHQPAEPDSDSHGGIDIDTASSNSPPHAA